MNDLPKEEHKNSLNGVRGCAILMVLAFHSLAIAKTVPRGPLELIYFKLLSLGWTGVDLFFVLSGFLITRLLIRAKDHPRFFINFYGRRVMRIFPVYYVFLIILFLVLRIAYHGQVWYEQITENAPWYWLYAQNWLQVSQQVGTGKTYQWIAHLWSLAVEEQFYLAWPAVVFLVPKEKISHVCLMAFLLVLAVRCSAIGLYGPSEIIHRGTIFRLDGLMAGGFLASLQPRYIERLLRSSLWISIGALIILPCVCMLSNGFGFSEFGMESVGYSILALFFMIVICHAAHNWNGLFAKVLAFRGFTFFGKYSYSMYIFHWPVMNYAGAWWKTLHIRSLLISHVVFALLTTCITILISLSTWHLIEKRALALKRYFQ